MVSERESDSRDDLSVAQLCVQLITAFEFARYQELYDARQTLEVLCASESRPATRALAKELLAIIRERLSPS